MTALSPADFQAMAEFRYQIRRFLHQVEQVARAHGLAPQQVQLLLALKGQPDGQAATVSDVAERLQIERHSAAELINRAVDSGLVCRQRLDADRRKVHILLTPAGDETITRLAVTHHRALDDVGASLLQSLGVLLGDVPIPADPHPIPARIVP